MNNPKTPCIGICSTTSLGDSVCRGCKRYSFEVINWNSYDVQSKEAVLKRIEKLVCQIIGNKFKIISAPTLKLELEKENIPFNSQLSPYCWLHNLLKKKHNEISDLKRYGVDVLSGQASTPLPELSQNIEEELLVLCQAHFDRYYNVA